MDEQQTELENQQNKTENIETFDQSELNSKNTVSAEPIMQKPIDIPEPVKKKKGINIIIIVHLRGQAILLQPLMKLGHITLEFVSILAVIAVFILTK